MARDFIKITQNANATQASTLIEYSRQLRRAYDQGKRVLAIMNHNQDGSDFTDIEALFGLEAGKGQTVYDLMNGSIGSMEGTFQVDDAKEITERIA